MADISRSILRKIRDLTNNPKDYLQMVVDQLDNATRGREAVINREGAGYRKLSPDERRKRMIEGSLDTIAGPLGGGLGIIKNRGGNWLTGSVENALKSLKRVDPEVRAIIDRQDPELNRFQGYTPGVLARQDALDRWIEGPLTKYVKRDMATPEDPVRALAEEGILHVNPEQLNFSLSTHDKFPLEGQTYVAKSDPAKMWEGASDLKVGTPDIRDLDNFLFTENPWLRGLPVGSKVHLINEPRYLTDDLGFSHLIDELQNALNPESGLPRHLLLTPEKTQQMGMEKAVRHVDAINKWREAEMLKAKKAAAEGIPVRKEYKEGYRWLDAPDTADEKAMKFINEVGCEGGWCTQSPNTARRYGSGEGRLHVLVDPEGRPAVQIATKSKPFDNWGAVQHQWAVENPKEYEELARKFPDLKDQDAEFRKMFADKYPAAESIVEIKGKQNRAPKEDYLPFVQDFVKSGKWSDVGDLHNTGLKRRTSLTPEEQTLVEGEYLTMDEIKKLREGKPWTPIDDRPEFAQGGLVKGPEYFDDLDMFLRGNSRYN